MASCRCYQVPLPNSAERLIQPFILTIDGLDNDQVIDVSYLYALRFNLSRSCQDKRPNAAWHMWHRYLAASQVHLSEVSNCQSTELPLNFFNQFQNGLLASTVFLRPAQSKWA